MAANIWLGLGSNLGDREAYLEEAIERISRQIGTIVAQSSIFYNPSWGYNSNHEFANMVIQVTTTLSIDELLCESQKIERMMGRTHKSTQRGYEDRPIDIDIILVDQMRLETQTLTIPHSLFRERVFVLAPLAQISPLLIDPITGETIQRLLDIATQKQASGL